MLHFKICNGCWCKSTSLLTLKCYSQTFLVISCAFFLIVFWKQFTYIYLLAWVTQPDLPDSSVFLRLHMGYSNNTNMSYSNNTNVWSTVKVRNKIWSHHPDSRHLIWQKKNQPDSYPQLPVVISLCPIREIWNHNIPPALRRSCLISVASCARKLLHAMYTRDTMHSEKEDGGVI